MCFIATIIRIKEDDTLLFPIAKLLLEEQASNDDGTGVYCFNKDNAKTYHKRMMRTEPEYIIKNLQNFDVVNYHFRQATEGQIDVSNVHFWSRKGWLFAHNGIIAKFGDKVKSDSLNFFEMIIEKDLIDEKGTIDYEGIKNFTNGTSFTGRFILIYAKTNTMYFFGDFHTYLIENKYMIVASSSCSLENCVSKLGLNFKVENDLEVLEGDIDGVYCFEPKTGFSQLLETFKIYQTSYYGGNPPALPQSTTEPKTPNWQEVMEIGGRIKTDDEEYNAEYKRITDEYEAKMQDLCKDGYTQESLDKIDELDEEYQTQLQELENDFLARAGVAPLI